MKKKIFLIPVLTSLLLIGCNNTGINIKSEINYDTDSQSPSGSTVHSLRA